MEIRARAEEGQGARKEGRQKDNAQEAMSSLSSQRAAAFLQLPTVVQIAKIGLHAPLCSLKH